MKLIVRWVVTGLALFAAAYLVPGIQVAENAWTVYAIMAIILGLVNAFVRPILKFLSCPLIIATLGLFIVIINAVSFFIASWLAVNVFKVDFIVQDFWAALLGSLIVSVVSVFFNTFLTDDDRRPTKKVVKKES